jgi:hypothetical protein
MKTKKETLEEAAKKYINLPLNKEMDEDERYFNSRDKEYDAYIAGAKWQAERMYSEEELEKISKELFFAMANCDKNIIHKESDFEKWFEQFKNK